MTYVIIKTTVVAEFVLATIFKREIEEKPSFFFFKSRGVEKKLLDYFFDVSYGSLHSRRRVGGVSACDIPFHRRWISENEGSDTLVGWHFPGHEFENELLTF